MKAPDRKSPMRKLPFRMETCSKALNDEQVRAMNRENKAAKLYRKGERDFPRGRHAAGLSASAGAISGL